MKKRLFFCSYRRPSVRLILPTGNAQRQCHWRIQHPPCRSASNHSWGADVGRLLRSERRNPNYLRRPQPQPNLEQTLYGKCCLNITSKFNPGRYGLNPSSLREGAIQSSWNAWNNAGHGGGHPCQRGRDQKSRYPKTGMGEPKNLIWAIRKAFTTKCKTLGAFSDSTPCTYGTNSRIWCEPDVVSPPVSSLGMSCGGHSLLTFEPVVVISLYSCKLNDTWVDLKNIGYDIVSVRTS